MLLVLSERSKEQVQLLFHCSDTFIQQDNGVDIDMNTRQKREVRFTLYQLSDLRIQPKANFQSNHLFPKQSHYPNRHLAIGFDTMRTSLIDSTMSMVNYNWSNLSSLLLRIVDKDQRLMKERPKQQRKVIEPDPSRL